jgi:mono/diheme cytochrome c family protein
MTEYQHEQFPIPTPGRLRRELRLRRPPWWLVLALIIVIIASWIPLYLIYQKRNSYSTLPKIHYIQDMDNQPGFGPQDPTTLFADGRATRSLVDGTVARGHLREDDHYFRGYQMTKIGSTESVEFFENFPDNVSVNEALIGRGAERYAIYCAVCHDQQGAGDGLVHQHAIALKEAKWVPPTNLLTQEIRDRPEGQVFQAISDGVRNMPGYKTQINVEDRWAIVAFVRQLQATQPVAVVEELKTNE